MTDKGAPDDMVRALTGRGVDVRLVPAEGAVEPGGINPGGVNSPDASRSFR